MKELLNKKAPQLGIPNEKGQIIKLEDFKGKYIILYFYPKDMTSGCTLESQNFRDHLDEIKSLNADVIGVSADSVKRHQKFIEKESLNFHLLSDEEKEVVNRYGVWVEKSMYGRKYMGIQRDTFLIDPNGTIINHYKKVKPKTHTQEVIEDLRNLSNKSSK